MTPPHVFALRVYYEDTDLAGIVYYANYFKYIERARTEWVRTLGVDQVRLKAETGIVFAVRRVEADYLAPRPVRRCVVGHDASRRDDGRAVGAFAGCCAGNRAAFPVARHARGAGPGGIACAPSSGTSPETWATDR